MALYPKNIALQEALTSHVLSSLVGMREREETNTKTFEELEQKSRISKIPHGCLR
jgi:hypothetical protein